MEIIMPSMRDEAYQIYLLRTEKYSFSEKEQFSVRNIFNDLEIPNYISDDNLDDRTLNHNDFIFDDKFGYIKLIHKMDHKIKAAKEYNLRLARNSTFHNIVNGNFKKDHRDLEDLLYYVKYLHYNRSALENPESAYHFISKNTKENNEFYKRYEVYSKLVDLEQDADFMKDDQLYLELLQQKIRNLRTDEKNESNDGSKEMGSQHLNVMKKRKADIELIEKEVKTLQFKIELEKTKKLTPKEMYLYSSKNIIKTLGNRTFGHIATLRKIFEDKVKMIKTNMKNLSIKQNKASRMTEIQIGSEYIFARYRNENSFPIGIIQHFELLEISKSNNLGSLPPTPVTTPLRHSPENKSDAKDSIRIKPLNLLQKFSELPEESATDSSTTSSKLHEVRDLYRPLSTPDSEPASIASSETSITCDVKDCQIQDTPELISISPVTDIPIISLSPVTSKSINSSASSSPAGSRIDADIEFESTREPNNNSENNYDRHILYLIPSSSTKSQRRIISKDLAGLIKELIDGDKNFSTTLNTDTALRQKDLDIQRAQTKIELLDKIIEKSEEVRSDIVSRGKASPIYHTKSFYENVIKEAKADRGAIKALSKFTGLMFFSPVHKHKTLESSPFFIQTTVAAVCVAKTPTISPAPSPENSPRRA